MPSIMHIATHITRSQASAPSLHGRSKQFATPLATAARKARSSIRSMACIPRHARNILHPHTFATCSCKSHARPKHARIRHGAHRAGCCTRLLAHARPIDQLHCPPITPPSTQRSIAKSMAQHSPPCAVPCRQHTGARISTLRSSCAADRMHTQLARSG